MLLRSLRLKLKIIVSEKLINVSIMKPNCSFSFPEAHVRDEVGAPGAQSEALKLASPRATAKGRGAPARAYRKSLLYTSQAAIRP